MTFFQRLKLAYRIVFEPRLVNLTTPGLALTLTYAEKGEKEIDIAQASEAVKVMRTLLKETDPRSVVEWLYKE